MLEILSPPWPKPKYSINFPRLNYNRSKLNDNWIKSRNYYRASSNYAPSNHILTQILSSISFDKNQSPKMYYDCLDDADYYFAQVHGLVSDVKKANVYLNGYFYGGRKSVEVYLHDVSDFDITSNWRDWQPVIVRHSNFIDYSYSVPERGNINNNEEGLTVISINIKMLAMQYYYYLKSDTDILFGDVKRNIASFVFRYPLCNMLPSIIDNSYLNEYRSRILGNIMHSVKETNPNALGSHSYMFEATITDVIKYYRSARGLNIPSVLVSIPMIFCNNPLELYSYNHRLTNINNIWILAYLSACLINLGQEISISKDINSAFYKKVLHDVRIIENSRLLEAGNKKLFPRIKETVDLVVSLIH